jgi:hypothetical protein
MPGSSPGLRGHCIMHQGCMISRCKQPCQKATTAFQTRAQVFLLHYIHPQPVPKQGGTASDRCLQLTTSISCRDYECMALNLHVTVHHHDVTCKYMVKAMNRSGVHKPGRQNLVRWRLILVAQNFEVTPKI